MINRQQQHGLTLIGLVFWGIVLVFVALAAMKLVPAYAEFFEIRKILKDLGTDPALNAMSSAEIRERFAKRAMIDNISAVTPADLEISRGKGKTVVSVDYTFKAPLVANVSLVAEFSASSESREGKVAQQLE